MRGRHGAQLIKGQNLQYFDSFTPTKSNEGLREILEHPANGRNTRAAQGVHLSKEEGGAVGRRRPGV